MNKPTSASDATRLADEDVREARVAAFIEFLQQDEARLLARKRELEIQLRQAGLETSEAIRAAYDRLDASARGHVPSGTSGAEQAQALGSPLRRSLGRRLGQML